MQQSGLLRASQPLRQPPKIRHRSGIPPNHSCLWAVAAVIAAAQLGQFAAWRSSAATQRSKTSSTLAPADGLCKRHIPHLARDIRRWFRVHASRSVILPLPFGMYADIPTKNLQAYYTSKGYKQSFVMSHPRSTRQLVYVPAGPPHPLHPFPVPYCR